MDKNLAVLIGCCFATIAALLVVGAVSHEVIRHIVQTSPLFITIALGMRGSGWSKWVALPCFVFWLLLMTAIWLFLLGWFHIVSGTFSSTEIAMTIIVGSASIVGIVSAVRMKGRGVRVWPATIAVCVVTVLQLAAIRLSLVPAIAHRRFAIAAKS